MTIFQSLSDPAAIGTNRDQFTFPWKVSSRRVPCPLKKLSSGQRPRLIRLLYFLVAAQLLPLAPSAQADGKLLPAVLESGNNDLIYVEWLEVPQTVAMQPDAPRPSGDKKTDPVTRSLFKTMPDPLRVAPEASQQRSSVNIDGAIASRLVTLCLTNSESAKGNKGFDVQRVSSPRYVVPPGETVCTRIEPIRQTLFFWKADADKVLSLTLSSRLDLSTSDGNQITLDWVRD